MTDKEIKQQMDAMRAFDEPMPQVGIFWYDIIDHTFLKICKQELTPKRINEFAIKGIHVIHIEMLDEDILQTTAAEEFNLPSEIQGRERVFRGCVAWNINKFSIFVGQWAKPVEKQLSQMIEKEFALPFFEFVYEER